jgi:hypothetical protein
MLLLKEKIIYVHIPKTGGSAIESFLITHFKYDKLQHPIFLLTSGLVQNPKFVGANRGHRNLQHFSLGEIADNCSLFAPNLEEYEAFTVVRNPYVRAISCFRYQLSLPFTLHGHSLYNPEEKRFILNQSLDLYFNTDPMENDWGQHRVPQSHFINDMRIDCKIFKYEDGLENAIKNGITKHQIKIPEEGIPRMNDGSERKKIPKVNPQEYYSRTFIEKINTFYEEDFEYFGYEMLNPLDFKD